jgi:hypothetical protein
MQAAAKHTVSTAARAALETRNMLEKRGLKNRQVYEKHRLWYNRQVKKKHRLL